jgi:peroxiredoxin
MQQGRSAFGLIPALPATFLLDKEGQVAGAWQGMASHEDVSKAVETLLRR